MNQSLRGLETGKGVTLLAIPRIMSVFVASMAAAGLTVAIGIAPPASATPCEAAEAKIDPPANSSPMPASEPVPGHRPGAAVERERPCAETQTRSADIFTAEAGRRGRDTRRR